MEYRTKGKGKNRKVYPVDTKRRPVMRKQMSAKELADLKRVGIKHPGSLTDLGYHINEDPAKQKAALDRAYKKYGKEDTIRKLQELYRLDYNRPKLRSMLEQNIKYVEGK